MIIAKTAAEIDRIVSREKHKQKKVALVPTMGYLHAGHGALIEAARKDGCFVIVYIFVNPAQFNNPEDYTKYPVATENDIKFCESAGVDALFLPGKAEIYPHGIPDITITIPHLMKNMCAVTRPGHFEGVLLVLSRMFLITRPDAVYFGKKDYQQYKIMDYYIKSLGYKTRVIGVETVRDESGLALSSRNARLDEDAVRSAVRIPEALFHAASLVKNGETKPEVIKLAISEIIHTGPKNKIDYIEIVDPETLEPRTKISLPATIAVAVFTGDVRLIDNMEIRA